MSTERVFKLASVVVTIHIKTIVFMLSTWNTSGQLEVQAKNLRGIGILLIAASNSLQHIQPNVSKKVFPLRAIANLSEQSLVSSLMFLLIQHRSFSISFSVKKISEYFSNFKLGR